MIEAIHMDLAELFGLTRCRTCWCCGEFGLTVDDWNAVEPCMFCDEPDTQHASSQPMADAGRPIEIKDSGAEDRRPG